MVQTVVNMTFDASSGLKQKIFWKGASKNYVVYAESRRSKLSNGQGFMPVKVVVFEK